MPENPHHYTLRKTWPRDEDFVWAVETLRRLGEPEVYRGRRYTVIFLGGFKYWTMGDPIGESRTDGRKNTILINRKSAADADGPRWVSNAPSSTYDKRGPLSNEDWAASHFTCDVPGASRSGGARDVIVALA